MTEPIRQTQKKYGSMTMIAVIFVGLFFVLIGHKAVAKGLILGALFSVLNFVLMGEILPLVIGGSRKKSTFYSMGSIGLRYGLLAIPLVTALKTEAFSFAAAAVGIFAVQLVILADHTVARLFVERIKQI